MLNFLIYDINIKGVQIKTQMKKKYFLLTIVIFIIVGIIVQFVGTIGVGNFFIAVGALLFLVLLILLIIKIKHNKQKNNRIKKYSKLYSNMVLLNSEFKFYDIKDINLYPKFDSLIKLKQFDSYGYVKQHILSNKTFYKNLFEKVDYNIRNYKEYLNKYNEIEYTSEYEVKKLNLRISYEKFNKLEKDLHNSLKLEKPTTTLSFNCYANYTSPAGRNSYNNDNFYSFQRFKSLVGISNNITNEEDEEFEDDDNEYVEELDYGENIYSEEELDDDDDMDSENQYDDEIDFLVEVSNEVWEIENNERLTKIIENFVKQNELEDIELLAFPKNDHCLCYNLGEIYQVLDKLKNIEYTLISVCRYFKNDCYIELSDLRFAESDWDDEFDDEDDDDLDDNWDDKFDDDENWKDEPYYKRMEQIKQIRILYNGLVNQGFLQPNQKTLLCFLLSETKRKLKIKEFDELCEKYNITLEMSNDKIIDKLYSLDINQEEITKFVALSMYCDNTIVCGRNYTLRNYRLYSLCLEEAKKKVNKQVYVLKANELIDNLTKDRDKLKITINDIDLMKGFEFENFVAKMFSGLGYETTITKLSGDQGIDVIAKKKDFILAIQAKCYSGVVGNHAIMEAVAGMKYYGANKCLVITNSTFTKSAIELAQVNGVELWDRKILKEKIKFV